jgi:pyruvate kinase
MIRLAFIDERGLPDGHSPDALPVGGKMPSRGYRTVAH